MFFVIILCLCVSGCGDEVGLISEQVYGLDSGVQTELPAEVWAAMAIQAERQESSVRRLMTLDPDVVHPSNDP